MISFRMKIDFRAIAIVCCLLFSVSAVQAQQKQKQDSTYVPVLQMDMKIEVKVDSAQKGKLTDTDISRAVEEGVRNAFGKKKELVLDSQKGSASKIGSIYDRYLQKQEKKGRHLQRVDREELTALFVPKGQWMLGGSISYNEWDGDNLNYLVLKNIDLEGHTFSASPYFAYFIRNNLAVGGRFNYSRYFFNLGKFDLNLGEDFNISLSDLYLLEHHYESSAFLRNYMPIGRSKVFGFFAEARLTYGYSKGKNTTGKGVEYEGTMERVNSIQLGLCPGMTAFATDFMAVECSIGVMGLKYKWVNQETNRVEKGKNRLGGANFKINLLSVNIGMTFYL